MATAIASGIPLPVSADIARHAGRLMFAYDRRRRRRALFNLGLAFPDMPPEARQALAIRSIQNFLRVCVEMAVLPSTCSFEQLRRVTGIYPDTPPLPALAEPGPKVLVTGHFGNWEVLGLGLAHWGVPLTAVARRIDHPKIQEWATRARRRFGLRILDKSDVDGMHRVLQRGGVLGFVADQNAGSRGAAVPFFRRLAMAHRGPAAMALYYDVPIVCGFARFVRPGPVYRGQVSEVIRPEEWKAQPNPLYYTVARYQRALERFIRHEPEQYLWIHRRWKSRPQHERQGQDIPPRLRRRLLALPWMTDDLMADLAKPVDRIS